jgi:hypothetical protein
METLLSEVIHEEFNFDLYESVRQANDFSFLQKYKPAGVKDEDFFDQVEKYRVFYPSNNFVTERQIGEICRKYGLVLGSFMNFTGIIPVKNRLELKLFKLRPEDQFFTDSSIPGRVLNSFLGGRHGVDSAFESNGNITARSGFVPGDMNKPFELMPVGDTFVLVSANAEHDVYRIFLKVDVFGSEWLVDIGLGAVYDGTIWVRWNAERMGTRIVNNFEVSLTLRVDSIMRITKFCLSQNVSPMVVGPGTMFERYQGAVEVSDYRLRFKPGLSPVDTNNFVHVDDPIILQPVKYGYLVVTKWGEESKIAEIQNPATN